MLDCYLVEDVKLVNDYHSPEWDSDEDFCRAVLIVRLLRGGGSRSVKELSSRLPLGLSVSDHWMSTHYRGLFTQSRRVTEYYDELGCVNIEEVSVYCLKDNFSK